jgi:hypothetical protein
MKPMSGWISFAAIMMMIIGTLDFLNSCPTLGPVASHGSK